MTGILKLAEEGEASLLAGGAHLASPAAMASILSKGVYRRAPHVNLLSQALVDLAMGDITRLMVMMPPRHGKSETCSVWFPAWVEALWPERRIMIASYGHDLARDFSLRVRNLLVQHVSEIGVGLARDTKSGSRWKTRDGGGMHASGIRGSFTGRGADLLILDDAVKDDREASSPIIQRANWNWWQTTFMTRLQPNGRVLVVGTRWNENDLQGMLLRAHALGPAAEGYEPWTIINFPAEAEAHDVLGRRPGDPLWPEGGYDRRWIESTKVGRGTRVWNAVYQQRPAPIEGGIFKRSWFEKGRFELPGPSFLDEIVISWDMTFKETESGSYVVGQVWGRLGADFFLLDQVRDRWDFTETCKQFVLLAAKWPEASHKYVEDKANGPAVIASLKKIVPGVIAVEPQGGKVARANGVSAFVESGNVHVPLHMAWAQGVVDEAVVFDKGAFDDQVDAMTQALAKMALRVEVNPDVSMTPIMTRETPVDSFGYNPLEDPDADEEEDATTRRPRKRTRFGYDV